MQGASQKFQDWCYKRFISNPNYKLQVFPFEVIPLESNTFPHPSLPRLHALLEGLFQDPPQLRRHGLIHVHVFKVGPLDNLLELGEEERNRREPGQVSREVAPAQQCSLPGTVGFSGHCEQERCHSEAATSCPTTTLASSCTLKEANTAVSLCTSRSAS